MFPVRRWRVSLSAGLLAVLAIAPQALAQQDTGEQLEREQRREEELEDRAEQVERELSQAEEELAEVEARLAGAQGRLRQAEGRAALAEEAALDAEEARQAAVEAHEEARDELAQAEEELAAETSVLEEQVREGFKYGTVGATRGAMLLEMLRRVDDPNGFAVSMKQLRSVVDDQDDTVERVAELREQRQARAEEAARTRSQAAQAAEDAEATLEAVERLRDEAEALAEQVAEEQEAQRRAVAELEAQASDIDEVRERTAARRAELEEELRRERAASEPDPAPSGTSAGGGDAPNISGHCPVVGAVAGRDFSNGWGDPRSGGRSHKGTDIFADRGTPVVAIASGTVVRLSREDAGLGGLTVTYRTADGSEWYNAHLASVADGLAPGSPVSAGQQIGTVGASGNARGTPPHNHVGRRYQGDWVNPYPNLSRLC